MKSGKWQLQVTTELSSERERETERAVTCSMDDLQLEGNYCHIYVLERALVEPATARSSSMAGSLA